MKEHGAISGLDAAGKTTALYKLKLGEVGTTIPTIGKNFLVKTLTRYFTCPVLEILHKTELYTMSFQMTSI